MAKRKVRLADNITRVITIDDAATDGATIGVNLKDASGAVLTPAAMKSWLGIQNAASGATSPAQHSQLQGLSGDDHPQYLLRSTGGVISGDFTYDLATTGGGHQGHVRFGYTGLSASEGLEIYTNNYPIVTVIAAAESHPHMEAALILGQTRGTVATPLDVTPEYVGSIYFMGYAAGGFAVAGEISSYVESNSSGVITARLEFFVAPAAVRAMYIATDGGLVIGEPTGASKGPGTINAKNGLYVNGTLLTGTVGPTGPTGPTGPSGATGPTGASGSSGANPSLYVELLDHCFDWVGASAEWKTDVSASGSFSSIAGEQHHPGIYRGTTGTAAGAGYGRAIRGQSATVDTNNRNWVLSSTNLVVEALIRAPVLPNGTDTFAVNVGLLSSFSAANKSLLAANLDYTAGACKWTLTTRNEASTLTTISSTGTAPSANTWHHVKLVANTTSIALYVDGTLHCTASANLPDGGMVPYFQVFKSAGSADRSGDLDFIWVYQTYPSAIYS